MNEVRILKEKKKGKKEIEIKKEKLNKKKIIILVVLLVSWYILVFNFSSKNSEESDLFSKGIAYDVFSIGDESQKEWIIQESIEQNKKDRENNEVKKFSEKDTLDKYNIFLRKLAHFMEYALGGVLIFLLIHELKIFSSKVEIMVSIFICFVFAGLDEFHQLFVPGRSGQIQDVILDTCGGCFGICIVKMFKKCKKIVKKT